MGGCPGLIIAGFLDRSGDFVDAVESPAIAARATFRDFPPVFGSRHIRFPEWPSPALQRPSVIHGAISLFRVQENAVTIGDLDQANPGPDAACKFPFEGFEILSHTDCVRNLLDLLRGYPYETGARTAAAASALRALKREPAVIPGKRNLTVHTIDLLIKKCRDGFGMPNARIDASVANRYPPRD